MSSEPDKPPVPRTRVTLRCLAEDLLGELPCLEDEIAPEHPLLEEAKRVAPSAPQGLKRVLSVESPLVYRIRHSNWRGAIWVDDEHGLVWLLAARQREEGSGDDAYEHFKALFKAGRLLPSDDDYTRDRLETVARFLAAIRVEIPEITNEAREGAAEVQALLGGTVPVRVFTLGAGDLEEVWVAVSQRDIDGIFVADRIRDVIFTIFEESFGRGEWELTAEWPGGQLAWFEVARYGIQSRQG